MDATGNLLYVGPTFFSSSALMLLRMTSCREDEICNCNMCCIRFYLSFRLQIGTSNSHNIVQLGENVQVLKQTEFFITAQLEI